MLMVAFLMITQKAFGGSHDGNSFGASRIALIFGYLGQASSKNPAWLPNESELEPNSVRNLEYLQIEGPSASYLDYLFFR